MSARAKARVVGSVLLLVAVWPVAHRQLVTRWDVNPWRLYGFAMYCTPHGVTVDLIDRSGAEPERIEVASLPPAARAAFERFEGRRRALGALHPPDRLARTLFGSLPGVDRLTIAVSVFSLQPFAERITRSTRLYAFARGGFE